MLENSHYASRMETLETSAQMLRLELDLRRSRQDLQTVRMELTAVKADLQNKNTELERLRQSTANPALRYFLASWQTSLKLMQRRFPSLASNPEINSWLVLMNRQVDQWSHPMDGSPPHGIQKNLKSAQQGNFA
jgi:hypothetical protein